MQPLSVIRCAPRIARPHVGRRLGARFVLAVALLAVTAAAPVAGAEESPQPGGAETLLLGEFQSSVITQLTSASGGGGGGSDVVGPVIGDVGVQAGVSSATVIWATDEPADSVVEFGLSDQLGQVRSQSALVRSHSVTLSGLGCETTFHYRVASTDAAGNRSNGEPATFTTGACPQGSPRIDVWYGDVQRFGDPGFPQRWLNILGNARDPDGLRSIEYRVGQGRPMTLVHSPALNPRISEYGDFNVQLDRTTLASGRHLVQLTATDEGGAESTSTVEVEVIHGAVWPLPFEANWGSDLQSDAQVVDGLWQSTGSGIRTSRPGYDRLLAIGSDSWTEVDVTVPVIVHSLDTPVPGASSAPEHSGIGVAAGWRGHEEGAYEPWTGWPLGGLCFYYRLGPGEGHELFLFPYPWPPAPTEDRQHNWLRAGSTYMFRLEARRVDDQNSRYSCKLWDADDPEPSEWDVSRVWPSRAGSVLLVADFVDVTFGRVRIGPATP